MAGGTSLGRLYVDLLMQTGSFETDAGRAAKIAEKRAAEIDRAIAKMTDRVSGRFKAAGGAVAGFAAGFVAFDAIAGRVKAAIDYADKLDELSARLDIGTEKLSGWGYAAQLSGVDMDTLAGAIPKLSKEIAAGGQLWDVLGIKTKDATGKLRDVEDILPEVADRFAALQDATLEQALAQQLFGKSGAEMLEFLNRGGAGMQSLEDKARSLGIVIDSETAAKAAEFNDKLGDVGASVNGLALKLSAALLPQMTAAADSFARFASDGERVQKTADGVSSTFEGVAHIATGVNDVFQLGAAFAASLAAELDGVTEAASGLLTLDWNRLRDGVTQFRAAQTGAINAAVFGTDYKGDSLIQLGKPRATSTPKVPDPIFITPTSGSIPESARTPAMVLENERLHEQVAKLLAALAGGGKGAKGGKGGGNWQVTEAQRKFEALDKAVASMLAQQDEAIAKAEELATAGGKVGEAWAAAYSLQSGELAKLAEEAGKAIDPQKRLQILINAERQDQLKLAQEAADKLAEQQKGAAEAVRRLDLEREALGLSNHELAVREALLSANIPAGSKFAAGIEASVTALENMQKRADALDGVRDIAHEFLYDLPNGAADAWGKALDAIEQRLWQWAANGVLDQLLGPRGTSGQGNTGGILGGVLGSIFGGGTDTAGGIFASIFGGGRADGGPVMGGKMYAITEKGMPELLDFGGQQMLLMPPGRGGHVTPMRQGRGAGGGQPIAIHHHYAAPYDSRTADQASARQGRDIRRATNRNG